MLLELNFSEFLMTWSLAPTHATTTDLRGSLRSFAPGMKLHPHLKECYQGLGPTEPGGLGARASDCSDRLART